jgi:Sec-independent protein translocase protein TatA
MISFGQILILLLIGLLLFGDLRKIFNRILLFFANIKTIFQKNSKNEKED